MIHIFEEIMIDFLNLQLDIIMNDKYDVIIIGSGLGALSAASIFAQMQKKKF